MNFKYISVITNNLQKKKHIWRGMAINSCATYGIFLHITNTFDTDAFDYLNY